MDFKLTSEYEPTGDQPKAIEQLVTGVENGEPHQDLVLISFMNWIKAGYPREVETK